jgi:hypothetical protein
MSFGSAPGLRQMTMFAGRLAAVTSFHNPHNRQANPENSLCGTFLRADCGLGVFEEMEKTL